MKMKKFLLAIVCLVGFVACDDDEKVIVSGTSTSEMIVGEWVYDNPDIGRWEKQKFLNNMVFYYSCFNLNPYLDLDNMEGTYYYTQKDKKFTFTYANVLGGVTYQDAVIENISKYSYTATYYNDDASYTGKYTYHRLIDDVQICYGESVTPKYNRLITDTDIRTFLSNDTEIAEVDPVSGAITAGNKAGVTYVSVVTNDGDAYVEVVVVDPDNLFPDYSLALNMNEAHAKQVWPDYCVYAGPFFTDRIGYPVRGNAYAKMVTMWLDDNRNIESVQVELKSSTQDIETEIHGFLSAKYEYQSQTDGIYMYFDFSQPDVLPLAVYYSPSLNLVEYQKIEVAKDLWPDYTNGFGMTADELKESYGAPFYESGNSLCFMQENDYVDFVAFSLSSATNTVYASSAFLKTDCDWQEALNFLNRKYFYYEKGSEPDDNFFAFTNNSILEASNIGITFNGNEGLVTYVDLTASRHTSLSTSVLMSEQTHDILKVRRVKHP